MLTEVELDIAQLIARDLSDTEIVTQLHLAETSFVRHLLHLFHEFNVADRMELSARLQDHSHRGNAADSQRAGQP